MSANFILSSLYPFPRKGTETAESFFFVVEFHAFLIPISPQGDGNKGIRPSCTFARSRVPYTHFPARGRKHLLFPKGEVFWFASKVVPYTHFPARGRKHLFVDIESSQGKSNKLFLIPISPQGDGNKIRVLSELPLARVLPSGFLIPISPQGDGNFTIRATSLRIYRTL